MNLKELVKKDSDWIEKPEKMSRMHKSTYASSRLYPLVATSLPNQETYHKFYRQ